MNKKLITALLVLLVCIIMTPVRGSAEETCIDCHASVTPGIVKDWTISKHGENGLECETCHGDAHRAADDVSKAGIPTPETCAACHETRVEQYKKGKHGFAWAAMKAMPTMHWQPELLTEGMKGCGGCHKIGIKTKEDIELIKKDSPGFGTASCDS